LETPKALANLSPGVGNAEGVGQFEPRVGNADGVRQFQPRVGASRQPWVNITISFSTL